MTPKSKKIAIIGTHFVGKTTVCENLFNDLKDRGHNVGLLTEVIRDCPYPINEMATMKAQDWILDEQRRREKELGKIHDVVLMDRGVIDNFAYWKRIAEKNDLTPEAIKEKEMEVFEYSRNYDVIIWLQPFPDKIINDNFRSVDPDWRKEMHERVNEIMDKFTASYDTPVFVVNGSKKDVAERVRDIVYKNVFS